jgi:uncharacterized protein (TIGR02246 family)
MCNDRLQIAALIRFRYVAAAVVCFAIISLDHGVHAQQADTDAALRAAANAFVDAWNRHDMTAFRDLFSPDAQFVNVIAMYLDGREAIYDHHAPSHQSGWMRHSTITTTIRRVQVFSPMAGVVHMHWILRMDGWLGRLRPRTGEMTLVLTRGGDTWQVVSAHNTDAAPPIGAFGDWLVLAVIGGGLGACIAAVARATAVGTIVGSVTGMFVAAPLVVLLCGNAPIGGGFFGFGVLGIGVGVAVALLRRLFFGSVARRM